MTRCEKKQSRKKEWQSLIFLFFKIPGIIFKVDFRWVSGSDKINFLFEKNMIWSSCEVSSLILMRQVQILTGTLSCPGSGTSQPVFSLAHPAGWARVGWSTLEFGGWSWPTLIFIREFWVLSYKLIFRKFQNRLFEGAREKSTLTPMKHWSTPGRDRKQSRHCFKTGKNVFLNWRRAFCEGFKSHVSYNTRWAILE